MPRPFTKLGHGRQVMAIQRALRQASGSTIINNNTTQGDSTGAADLSDASFVTVTMPGTTSQTGTVSVPAGSQYAIPLGFSEIPTANPSDSRLWWNISGTTLTVAAPNNYAGSITFLVF